MSIEAFLLSVLEEDLGRGDLFSLVAQDQEIEAVIRAKSDGIFSGQKYLKALCEIKKITLNFAFDDRKSFCNGDILAKISGSYIEVLKIERTILNILQHSSGIATKTSEFVQKLKNQSIPIRLLDTRKTRPLLRDLEKYSVRNGGAHNHRFGLDDALMLKDTHLSKIVNLKAFIKEAREKIPFTSKIEVECESVQECKNAMEAGADIVMCDNMGLEQIQEVVAYRNRFFAHILLEASGNITLDNIEVFAQSGIDALSCGSLIHQAVWLDMSMKIQL